MNDRAMVQNAADSKQVRHAGRKEKDRRSIELSDLNVVLATREGRRFLWRVMAFCGYGENPANPRGDVTHQNIGKADVAKWLISEIGQAGGIEPWLLMQREAWVEKSRDGVEAEAVRTASADQSQSTGDDNG